jgi:hypothetical protein
MAAETRDSGRRRQAQRDLFAATWLRISRCGLALWL